MTQSMIRAKEIAQDLKEQSDENNIVKKSDVDKAIHKHAGFDKRTIRKYLNILKQYNMIGTPAKYANDDNPPVYKVTYTGENYDKPDAKNIANGPKRQVTLRIPYKLYDAAKNNHIDMSKKLTRAIIDEINDLEHIIKLNTEKDSKEREYIKKLILKDACLANEKDKLKKELYKQVFNSRPQPYHIKDLRKEAADIAEKLGMLDI